MKNHCDIFFKARWVGIWSADCLIWQSHGCSLPSLPSELAPLEDRSMVGLAVIAPEGTSYESMEETMKAISNYVSDSIPDLNENRTYAGIAASIGTLVQPVNGGFQWIFLKEPKDRKSGLTQAQVYQKLIAASQKFRNVIVIPIQIPTIGGFSSSTAPGICCTGSGSQKPGRSYAETDG